MPKSVLIIDDQPQITAALMTRLEACGYEVFHAVNGLAGVEAAALHRPDLILMDVRMPDIDGYDACQRIKRLPGLSATPIVFLSANSQEAFRKKAFDAGGALFIAKPYKAANVIDAVGRLTQQAPAATKEC